MNIQQLRYVSPKNFSRVSSNKIHFLYKKKSSSEKNIYRQHKTIHYQGNIQLTFHIPVYKSYVCFKKMLHSHKIFSLFFSLKLLSNALDDGDSNNIPTQSTHTHLTWKDTSFFFLCTHSLAPLQSEWFGSFLTKKYPNTSKVSEPIAYEN